MLIQPVQNPLVMPRKNLSEVPYGSSQYGSVISNPATVGNGSLALTLKGQTAENKVTNGDFSNGTTGWTASGGSASATNNVLTLTGAGSSILPRVASATSIPYVSGNKIAIRATMRVTNVSCLSLQMRAVASGMSTQVGILQSNPVQNTWYSFFAVITLAAGGSGNVSIDLGHLYLDNATANGKVMEIKNVITLDLTALGLTSKTAAELDAMFPHYFAGLQSVKPQKVTSQSADAIQSVSYQVPVTLRKLPNGVQDEFNVATGILTKRVSDSNTQLAQVEYVQYDFGNLPAYKNGAILISQVGGTLEIPPEAIITYKI